MTFERLNEQFAFLQKAENLKNTLRSARTSAGRRESSAEHTWRLCLMILTFEKELDGLDVAKLLKLAVVHDLAEAVYGDIPAIEQGTSRDKEAEEKQAMDELLADLPPDVKTHFLDLWNEYEEVQTAEAKFLKGLDKLETILQHNQGLNEPDFDYEFNLSYGKQYMDAHPLLVQMRSMLDQTTRERANQKGKSVPPKQIISRWIELFNQADAATLAELYHDNAVNHQVANEPIEGKENIRAMFEREFAVAEMVCIPENLFEDGEWAILEWRDQLGLRGCGFFHLVDGKIKFQRGYWDKLSFLRQHGLPLPTE